MVAKVDIVSYGSNQLRKKLNYIPELDLSKNRLLEPVIRGKGYKARNQMADIKKKDKVVDPRDKRPRRNTVVLDKPENY
jgi:hypothetical protein